jgi:peroxiredoxin
MQEVADQIDAFHVHREKKVHENKKIVIISMQAPFTPDLSRIVLYSLLY